MTLEQPRSLISFLKKQFWVHSCGLCFLWDTVRRRCCRASLALDAFEPQNAAVLQQLLHCSYCSSFRESLITWQKLLSLVTESLGGWNNKGGCIPSEIVAADNGFEMWYWCCLTVLFCLSAAWRREGIWPKSCLIAVQGVMFSSFTEQKV